MTTPAGWYDDQRGALRWWDGAQWTEHTQAPDAAAAVDAAATTPASAPASDAAAALGFGVAPPTSTPPSAGYPASDVVAPPGGYPGGYAQPLAPGMQPGTAGLAPKKRSLWWVWVLAGVAVLISLVVLAAIFIPLALRAVTSGATGLDGGTADETAAIATVQTYDRAWQTADCDLLFSATTEAFRENYDLADCDDFADQSLVLTDTTTDYTVTVTSVQTGSDGTITVETTETYDSTFDRDLNDTGVVESYSDDYTYLVEAEQNEWLIDAFGNE